MPRLSARRGGIIRTFAKALLLLLAARGLAGSPRVSPPRILVEAPPELAGAAAYLESAAPRGLAAGMRLTGLADPGPPIRVLLVTEGSALAGRVPAWISGFADGATGVAVLIPSRAPAYPDDDLGALFGHEVAHILIARAAGGRPVPRWFNEGLALSVGRPWGLEDRGRLAFELISEGRVPLEKLDERFGRGQAAARGAYALSGAFVRDLLDRFGEDAAARILARVAAGDPVARAFSRAIGTTREAAEASYWRRQNFWGRWVPFLASSTALWMAVALLALLAARRRRARSALLRRQWEEEELALASEPDAKEIPKHPQ